MYIAIPLAVLAWISLIAMALHVRREPRQFTPETVPDADDAPGGYTVFILRGDPDAPTILASHRMEDHRPTRMGMPWRDFDSALAWDDIYLLLVPDRLLDGRHASRHYRQAAPASTLGAPVAIAPHTARNA